MFVDLLPSRDSNNESDLDEVEIGYSFHGVIAMDAEMCAMNDDAIINLIMSHIESADGYKYYCLKVANPKKKHAVAFYFGCAQDQCIQSQVMNRQRLTRRMETFPCSGRITGEIDRRNHQVMVDIQHDVGHRGYAVEDTSVPTIVREYIRNNARRLDATAFFEQVKAKFPDDASDQEKCKTLYVVDSLSLRPFSHVDTNGCEENGLASQRLVNKMPGEYPAIKSILPLKRSFESMNASICINCSPAIVPALTNIISSSPYSKLLMQRQYTELTPDVCAIINKDWDFFPQIKFATVQIFAGAILYNTTNGQAFMLNTVEAYGRTKSIDPHREPFGKLKGSTKPTSLPPPGKIPYPDIWPVSLHTSEGSKLVIGTLVSNILVTSNMRLDAVSKPSIGAVTLNFKLDKKDALAPKTFLDHDNLQVALSMATDPAVTRTSDTNIVYQLRQIHSKFDADNAYSLCRASGPFTKSHVCQPFTIFTLADYDRGTSSLSSLFRHMATIVLRLGVRATLAKATVESSLGQGNLDTQNAFTAIIALYGESNEIPILGK
ncbi:hypothetical protein BX666DRAFT_1932193 [Dichotomocladium elegans]|nr:hypothetical protein BX666DRAFT_1932193 [Dichotomocladium elegans]